MNLDTLNSFVKEILKPLNVETFQIERLRGGGNNQAYRIDCAHQNYFLKLYHQDPEDPRHRGVTEYRWLETLWKSGIKNIPQPIGFQENKDFSAGVYEYISGRAISTDDVHLSTVQAAVDFIQELNQVRNNSEVQKLPIASEACFSYQEHWQTLEKRIQRLQQIQPAAGSLFQKTEEFVAKNLLPVWKQISKNRPRDFEKILSPSERILSPSDFGFHNALLTQQNKIRFIDFEYAGWDDPAKLICDFFNQVAVPVPMEFYPVVVKSFANIDKDLQQRTQVLFPLYQLKWICILLNHFLPSDSRRKKFALQNASQWETLLNNQLQKAMERLENINLK